MAYTLINRNKFIPGAYVYYQPETKWQARPGSFSNVVQQLISHRQANPWLNLPTDQVTVENEVDAFCALVCAQNNWMDYIVGGGGGAPPPKLTAPSPEDLSRLSAVGGAIKKIWAGVRTINDWIDSKEDAVPRDQSEARAKICATSGKDGGVCPFNGQGDFSKWFTRPASEVIKRQIGKLSDLKLSTTQDEKLNICEACLCPLKLKVHAPLKFITPHMIDIVIDDLKKAPACWIISELSK